MSLKIRKLAEDLQLIFRNVSVGHCLRIDDLPVQEGIQLCEYIAGAENNFPVYILESNLSPFGNNPYIIRTDTAIRKRNQQKNQYVLLFQQRQIMQQLPRLVIHLKPLIHQDF